MDFRVARVAQRSMIRTHTPYILQRARAHTHIHTRQPSHTHNLHTRTHTRQHSRTCCSRLACYQQSDGSYHTGPLFHILLLAIQKHVPTNTNGYYALLGIPRRKSDIRILGRPSAHAACADEGACRSLPRSCSGAGPRATCAAESSVVLPPTTLCRRVHRAFLVSRRDVFCRVCKVKIIWKKKDFSWYYF